MYDLAIVGAGAAGAMAALATARYSKQIILVERNSSALKKILLTGKGRCNLTNTDSLDEFITKFGASGAFLRTAFTEFSNSDLMDFFEVHGLKLKTERQGRVFPVSDDSRSVVNFLEKSLVKSGIKVIFGARVLEVKKKEDFFELILEDKSKLMAKKVILASGGASYKSTGSTGDGFKIAQSLGHKVNPLFPGLVPLKIKETFVKELDGLILKNVSILFKGDKSGKLVSPVGELSFTYFGVSGALILDLSSAVNNLLKGNNEVNLYIDLKPGLTLEQIEKRLLQEIRAEGLEDLSFLLKNWLPLKLIPVFVKLSGLDPQKKINQLKAAERTKLRDLFKAFKLTVYGSLPLEEGMITCGGVSLREINPRTLESKLISGLYFAGEMLDMAAPSGGYNLQAAFSTGYLAGMSAGKVLCGK